MNRYQPVIGLEVHCQLKTKSKIFSPDPYEFGHTANTQVGPITLGLPGVLPVLNRDVLHLAIMAGVALNCRIAETTKFDRKHYFYPDLPKGYQISQYDMPYAEKGYLEFDGGEERGVVRTTIERIHMEEDAGKLVHSDQPGVSRSYVDLNRAGVPLLEIVSAPELHSAEDAYRYLTTLKNILRYIDVSDCNMEEGSLRCDANVSVRPSPDDPPGTRVEIKNLNSFKAVRAAIEYEIERQLDLLETGREVIQCTALWDADLKETKIMRTKEDAEDYRYFPEPDLTVFQISTETVTRIREEMPELPAPKKERFMREYALPEYDAAVLTMDRDVADYFEDTVRISNDARRSSNWVKDEVLGYLNKNDLDIRRFSLAAENLGTMIRLINEGRITGKMAKQIFEKMISESSGPEEIIDRYNLKTVDVSELPAIVDKVIGDNPEAVQKILSGNDKVKGFLVGQVMKVTGGQAPPAEVNQEIDRRLARLQS